MRRGLRSGIGLVSLLAAGMGGVACNLLLGIPADTEELANVSRLCTCSELADQGTEFTERCAAGVELLDEQELLAAARKGCASCGDAIKAGVVGECYADIIRATQGECVSSSDCESFACGLTDLKFTDAAGLTYEAVCVSECNGCSQPTDGYYCVDAADEVAALAECLCRPAGLVATASCRLENGPCGPACASIQEKACADCLIEQAAQQGVCGSEISECANNSTNRPVTPPPE